MGRPSTVTVHKMPEKPCLEQTDFATFAICADFEESFILKKVINPVTHYFPKKKQ